jgi:putative ABC transport system substrate-binding protein
MSRRCNRAVALDARRRALSSLAALGLAGFSPLGRAQTASKLPVLGVLTPHPPLPPDQAARHPITLRLKELGWGKTFEMERPDAEGREERLPAIAEELVRKRVSVIWAIGPEAAVAAARATQTIPIVFWGAGAPVELGLVNSFAKPGRNVTGMAFTGGMESTKILEALTEIAPQAKRLAQIVTPSASTNLKGELVQSLRPAYEKAAKELGLELARFEIAKVEDFEAAFSAVLKWRAAAVFVPGTTLTFRERQRFVDFANKNRLPSCFNQREFVISGGLFSYGIDSHATVLHSLNYVDRILRGAKPSDLPVELPSKYEFVVNQKTASGLGLKIPRSVLLRADRVIE